MMFKKVALLFLITTVAGAGVYLWIRSLPATAPRADFDLTATPKLGEQIFWGQGRCHVCHRIGERGYALRGPNLGQGPEGAPIAVRARQRARRLGLPNGTAYLVQSLVEPGAFVVPGFKNEMPLVYRAPIALSLGEMKAVVLYLQTLGDTLRPQEVRFPPGFLAGAGVEEREPEIRGDPLAGQRLFFDRQGPAACVACHTAPNADGVLEGERVGPDLSAVGGIRSGRYLLRKLVQPDSNLVSGYDLVLAQTRNGVLYSGVLKRESADRLVLVEADGAERTLRKHELARWQRTGTSLMPGNYAELLTTQQLHDLVAYLLTLTGD